MKFEKNMYVRTDDGYINKIKKVNQYNVLVDARDLFGEELNIPNNEIVKASHNIIDLIGEKDLLEIEYFSLRYEKRVTRLFEVTFKDGRFTNLDNSKCQFMLINNDWSDSDKELEPIIKSIVTKEQFESMQYRIGE